MIRLRTNPYDIIIHAILIITGLLLVYPFLYLLSVSLSSAKEVPYVTLLPLKPTLIAYEFVFSIPSILGGYKNTVVYTGLYTLLGISLTTMCAYPLSKKWLPGRKIFTIIIVITMFFSGGLIPFYLTVKSLGMIDTVSAIVVPSALSTWLVIITRTFFQNIPLELEEASYIDGANEFDIFVKIFLPLSKPIIATLALYYAVGKWNSWFDASIFLNDKDKYPIQLVLRNQMVSYSTSNSIDMNDLTMAYKSTKNEDMDMNQLNYALTFAVILPIIFVYPFLQKYFIKGVMIGSLKG